MRVSDGKEFLLFVPYIRKTPYLDVMRASRGAALSEDEVGEYDRDLGTGMWVEVEGCNFLCVGDFGSKPSRSPRPAITQIPNPTVSDCLHKGTGDFMGVI